MRRGKILVSKQMTFVMASLHDEAEENCGPDNSIAWSISTTEESAILALREACGPNGKLPAKGGFTIVYVNNAELLATVDQMQPAVEKMKDVELPEELSAA